MKAIFIRFSLIFLLILSCHFVASCQDLGKLEFVADLPGTLTEVSGIELTQDSPLLWAVNDSRNKPRVYGFDIEKQKIVEEIKFEDATNIDWEDLATHPNGTLFIGDFGNNMSNRQDLVIYWVNQPGEIVKEKGRKDEVDNIVTSFYFEDQSEYPPKKKKDRRFDVEAFIYTNGYFYLFTRHRDASFNGKTNVYQLNAQPGRHKAKKIGSFDTCDDSRDCQITGSAVHHPTGKIALLSHDKVWLLTGFDPDKLEETGVEKVKLDHSSQKESICFKNEFELYIADERSRGSGRNLYSLDLKAHSKSE